MTDHHDLDMLLGQAARNVRPRAEFEEDLLVRLEDQLTGALGQRDTDDVVELIDLHRSPGRDAQPARRRSVLAIAAALVLLVGVAVAVLMAGGDQSTTIQSTLPQDAVDVLGPVCAAHRETIDRYAVDAPLVATDTATPGRDAQLALRQALDDLAAAVTAARTLAPADTLLRAVAAELDGIDDLLRDEETVLDTGRVDQARYSMPLVARQLDAVAHGLVGLGVQACKEGEMP